jgi:hypothetical protein
LQSGERYHAIMPATSEQLCDALDRIYNEDGTADKIPPAVIAKLITLETAGMPQLTAYG